MKVIIMCGGEYDKFKTPKQLSVIKGERLADRTIRLLKENGVSDINISSNNPIFDSCGVNRLEHTNTYVAKDEKQYGYWLDAFYPVEEPVIYLYGDVYYSDQAIKTILNYKGEDIVLFGTSAAKNKYHQNWGEPFGWIVKNYKLFFKCIDEVKKLQDKGKIIRHPVTWELYRYINGLDINVQQVLDKTYVCIDDGTMDVDIPEDIEALNE